MIRSDRYLFLKYGSYALLLLGLFLLQSTRGTGVQLWGASPDVLPFFVAAVALLDGPYAGGAFGFAAGVLTTLNSTGIEGFASLYYALFGIFFGLFGAYFMRNILFSALSGGILCMLIEAFFRYLFYDLLFYGMGLGQALAAFGLQLLLSLPVGALCYLLLRAVWRRFSEDSL